MSLDEQLYQHWLLQAQTWISDGRLFSRGVDALQLKPGQATDQLNRILNRLSKIDTQDIPLQLRRSETSCVDAISRTSSRTNNIRSPLVVSGSATTGLQAASWLELPADKHPFAVINKTLRHLRRRDEDVKELHLIAHGNSDGIELAGEWIDKATLLNHGTELAQWRVKTIVLWCCNIGQNKDFIKVNSSRF